MGPALDVGQLYQELSQLTQGVTLLDTYTLDRDSLYVNGKCLRCCGSLLQSPVSLYQ